MCASDGALADARGLTQEFANMVRGLEGEKLDGWLEEAEASETEVMRKFAAGLKKDLEAVRAVLTESWSILLIRDVATLNPFTHGVFGNT